MVFPAPGSVRDGIQLMSLSALRPGNGMLLPGRQRAGCPCGRGGAAGAGGAPGCCPRVTVLSRCGEVRQASGAAGTRVT